MPKKPHPCSFPIELVERCILLIPISDLPWTLLQVLGQRLGALMHERRAIGWELKKEYMDVAKERVQKLEDETLPYRLWENQSIPQQEKRKLQENQMNGMKSKNYYINLFLILY